MGRYGGQECALFLSSHFHFFLFHIFINQAIESPAVISGGVKGLSCQDELHCSRDPRWMFNLRRGDRNEMVKSLSGGEEWGHQYRAQTEIMTLHAICNQEA